MIPIVERAGIPDNFARVAINMLVARTSKALLAQEQDSSAAFARTMREKPIATHVSEANTQHYELPPTFFGLVLGPHRKYSCCYYESETSSLVEGEKAALEATARHADIADGQAILELGCGWGSFALFAAQRFPNAKIVAVSNSSAQREYIENRIRALGINNLYVVTADMNEFQPDRTFDRVVSIEMFEHMANCRNCCREYAHGSRPKDDCLFMSSVIVAHPIVSITARHETGLPSTFSPAGSCQAITCFANARRDFGLKMSGGGMDATISVRLNIG